MSKEDEKPTNSDADRYIEAKTFPYTRPETPTNEELVERIEWYIACLRNVIARSPVRGLDEAQSGYASALATLSERLQAVEERQTRLSDHGAAWEGKARAAERRAEAYLARTRDDALELTTLADQVIAAEQRVAELEEALREALDIIVWMSGADDFGPEGKAHEGWKKARDKLDRLFPLAAGSKEQE